MTSALPFGYRIRAARVADAEALAAAYQRNRDHLAPWDPVRTPAFYTADGQHAALARQLGLVQKGLGAAWILERGGDVVGRVNLNNIVHGVLCSGTLGYWVAAEHQRRGLATAGVQHACAEALTLGLHRVEAGTMVANDPSRSVLLRCGFERYGTAPKLLFVAGGWQDHELYQRILHDNPV